MRKQVIFFGTVIVFERIKIRDSGSLPPYFTGSFMPFTVFFPPFAVFGWTGNKVTSKFGV